MGLDMYLRASISLYKAPWNPNSEDTPKIDSILATIGASDLLSEDSPGVSVEVTVMYWRKANAIHGWFVRNCADDVDECQPIYVSREQLEELVQEVERELNGDEEADLDPTPGFFFGSTERDEYYYEDLRHTKEGLTKLLADERLNNYWTEFIYQASW